MNITAANIDAVLGEWAHRTRCEHCGAVSPWSPIDAPEPWDHTCPEPDAATVDHPALPGI